MPGGRPARIDGDGLLIDGVREEQQQDLARDQYVCHASYPVAEKYRSLSQEEHLARWYAYLLETYVPCVEALGYEISEPPTLETFLASGGSQWIPNEEVFRQSQAQDEDFTQIEEQCPQDMPLEMLEQ